MHNECVLDSSSVVPSPWISAKVLRESKGSYRLEVKPSSKRRGSCARLPQARGDALKAKFRLSNSGTLCTLEGRKG